MYRLVKYGSWILHVSEVLLMPGDHTDLLYNCLKVCMAVSAFNSPSESNYAPIKGECLGAASALHKTRYYIQGCDNPWLIHLKEKTLGWRFKIIHIPGKKLCGPDTLSQDVTPVQGEVQMMAWGQGDINHGQHLSWERYPSSQEVREISTSDYLW